MCITKVQQKYKGVRRIERRPLTSKKQTTNYPDNYVHKKKVEPSLFGWCSYKQNKNSNVKYIQYKLIYQ